MYLFNIYKNVFISYYSSKNNNVATVHISWCILLVCTDIIIIMQIHSTIVFDLKYQNDSFFVL